MLPERKFRVLVVEDDQRLRSVLAQVLADWGYEADMAADGIEALEKIDSFHPLVVISDFRMPRMDGLQLLNTIRETTPGVNFILVSGSEHLSKARSPVGSAICRFLQKPLDPDQLKSELRNCLAP
jgi:two-component system, NtrC family, nitrogen regulation response regulator NtrX